MNFTLFAERLLLQWRRGGLCARLRDDSFNWIETLPLLRQLVLLLVFLALALLLKKHL